MADFPDIPQDPLPVFDEETEAAMAKAPPRKGFADLFGPQPQSGFADMLERKYAEPESATPPTEPMFLASSAIWHLEQKAAEVQQRNPFDGYITGVVTGLQMALRAIEEIET